jgi:PIN domain nuclease of toxin-antitoxin system
MLNLDTHILVYALADMLTAAERKLLRKHDWAISAIVLLELAKLVQLKRLEIDLESAEFSRLFGHITVLPLDLSVARRSTELDFRSDPADELIAATSIVYKIPLLTRDRAILKSKLVPFAR